MNSEGRSLLRQRKADKKSPGEDKRSLTGAEDRCQEPESPSRWQSRTNRKSQLGNSSFCLILGAGRSDKTPSQTTKAALGVRSGPIVRPRYQYQTG